MYEVDSLIDKAAKNLYDFPNHSSADSLLAIALMLRDYLKESNVLSSD